VIAKTISPRRVVRSSTSPSATPRLKTENSAEIYGWQNIEMISDRPFAVWIDEFKQLRTSTPTSA
jgi:hypothetical protein